MQMPLDFVPQPVRGHGLREAHPYPLVGKRTKRGIRSWRTSPDRAWVHELIQLENAGSVFATVTLDCDDRSGLWNLADLPPPNWNVKSPSGGAHVTWAFAKPVHRYPEARRAPLDFAARVSEFYASTVKADPGYSHTLSYNPCHADANTTWGRFEPYTLDDLATVVPAHWRRPEVSQTGIGRNCDLFRSLMRYAGRLANRTADLEAEAGRINAEFPNPLPYSEVRATARSVEGCRSRWTRHGWHDPRWLKRQAARGRASGRTRREGSNELLKPWELEDVSRRTWYRHRRVALEPTQIRGALGPSLPLRNDRCPQQLRRPRLQPYGGSCPG